MKSAQKRSRSAPAEDKTPNKTPSRRTVIQSGDDASTSPANVSRALDDNVTADRGALTAPMTAAVSAEVSAVGDIALPSVSVLSSQVVAPEATGVKCFAVNALQTSLVVARENGSLVLYHLDVHQNVPHCVEVRRTGGRDHRTIQKLAFTRNDEAILAAYFSGQIAVLCPLTLIPTGIVQRTGGAIYDFVMSGNFGFLAVADGSWRQIFYEASTRNVEAVQTVPKVTGADRALCVAVSRRYGLAVGGDDGGNVVAWAVPQISEPVEPLLFVDVPRACHKQLWSVRIPKGFPVSLAVAETIDAVPNFVPCVAVGSTIGDVTLLDLYTGSVTRRFSQHKGPVTTITCAPTSGVLYASGWHESLRSYRCSEDGEWFPGDVKRRTHYHEAVQVAVLDKHQLILSASRDGTIMHSPVATVFTSAARYLDTCAQCFAFAKRKHVLLQSRGNRIEAFRMSATKSHWVPLFSVAVQVDAKFGLSHLWCDEALTTIVVATDTRALVLRVRWEHDGAVKRLDTVMSRACVGVADCVLSQDGSNIYLLTAMEILHIQRQSAAAAAAASRPDASEGDDDIHLGSKHQAERRKRARFAMSTMHVVSTPVSLVLNQLYVSSETAELVAAGPQGAVAYKLLADGSLAPLDATTPRVLTSVSTVLCGAGSYAIVGDQRCTALTQSSLSSQQPQQLAASIPHDVTVLSVLAAASSSVADGQVESQTKSKGRRLESSTTVGSTVAAAPSSSSVAIAAFSRGLLVADSKTWTMLQRHSMVRAFVMQDGAILTLERNIEGSVESLPMCWKVRRFGN